MATAWFILINLAIAGFAVTDGFDLGVGILSPWMARDGNERGAVQGTIAGIWGANEVWLIAFGGLLFLAFPRAYAASFSGFYLAFMILLWCLIGRGLSIEMRSHLHEPVWRTACDVLFPVASFLIALALGTAAGNVLRGVPLDERGRFYLSLWTDLSVGGRPAIFDWYTFITGFLAVAVFSLHGANYLALKTDGNLRRRARRLAAPAWFSTAALSVAGLVLSPIINPALTRNYRAHPALYVLIAFAGVSLAATLYFRIRRQDVAAFTASSLFIIGIVASVAAALYPNVLPATPNPEHSLTIDNASAGLYGLTAALIWFLIGLGLIGFYTVFVYRLLIYGAPRRSSTQP